MQCLLRYLQQGKMRRPRYVEISGIHMLIMRMKTDAFMNAISTNIQFSKGEKSYGKVL